MIAGDRFPIVTPAHGTAYDIAGHGKANCGATFNAASLGRKLAAMERARGKRPRSADGLAKAISRILDPAKAS